MGAEGPRARRQFSAEFKREIADLYHSGERTVAEICRDFDLGDTAVRRWIEQSEGGKTVHKGKSLSENIERDPLVVALRKENTTLRLERDMLKRAAAFFAKEIR